MTRWRPPLALRLLLRLFPRSFRERHGEELLEQVGSDRAEPRWSGALGGARFWTRTSADLLRAALRLRLKPATPGSPVAPTRSAGAGFASAWLRDLRHAARALARTPMVCAVIVATLGLGIGLNTAIFSVVNAVLIEPLPYPEADRLVYLHASIQTETGERDTRLSGTTLRALRDEVSALAAVAAVATIRQNLTGAGRPRMAQVGWASRNLFDLLGVQPVVGRGFRPDDPPGTLMLDHALWRGALGSDPEVVGRTLGLDGYSYTVVGVLPPGFELLLPGQPGLRVDVWKVPDDWWQNGDVWGTTDIANGLLHGYARLAPDAAPSRLAAELEALSSRHRDQEVELSRVGFEVRAEPLAEAVVGDVRPTLLLLLGAVVLVLLIACANVTNLLLVRAQTRRREIALRLALGCSRGGIVRLLLSEGLLLAALGGGLGLALGVGGTRLLSAFQPGELPRAHAVGVDGAVMGFAAVAALTCVVLFALAPALASARGNLAREMAEGRSSAGRERQRLSRLLVSAQIALSLVLLIGAALLTTSLARLQRVEPGFDAEPLLSFSVSLPGTRYERPVGTDRFFRELERRVAALPGVEGAAVVWPLPLTGRAWSGEWSGGEMLAQHNALADYRLATPALFSTARIPMLAGRSFEDGDPRHVVVVSRAVAERAWPGRDAVGRDVTANPWGGGPEAFRVVGVVEDVRGRGLRDAPVETLYFDSRGWSWTDWEVDYVVRSGLPAATLLEPIREIVAQLDAEVPLARGRPLVEYVDEQLAPARFALLLLGLFAGVAAVLAVVGLYGVVSYAVSQRTREIGIRMALGAERRRILRLVLGQGARLAALGLALGLVAAVALTRFLGALLYGVGERDPLSFVAVTTGLAAVALVACYPPARRAMRLDPARTLRAD